MFCTKCGTRVPDEAAFCTSCGAPINSAPLGQPAQTRPQTPSNFVQPSPPVPTSTGETGVKSKLPLIIGLAAAVIVLAAVLVFMLLPHEQTIDDTSTLGSASHDSTSSAAAEANGKRSLDLAISQIDNGTFPVITLYASILEQGSELVDSVSPELFTITELGSSGKEYTTTIDEIAPLAVGDAMNINLVLDQSGSMDSSGKIGSAKSAASSFIDEITATDGNVAEITAFDDYVYNIQPFTSDTTLLKSAVSSLRTNGDTALYDALYWALQRTNLKSGSRVVIAFTDGEENASYYQQSDVIELSRMSGIPVYIIGIGESINRTSLQDLARQCNGAYYDVGTTNLQKALAEIYDEIYSNQRALYRIVYTSSYADDKSSYRTVRISCAGGSNFSGATETSYMPVDNVSSFETYVNSKDYVLPDSSTRYYSKAELEKLSLWELYLARNEIFARYGRGFKNQDLVEYFATRRWYHQTASPEEFDANPTPLNDYEQKNTVAMLEIEKARNSPYLITAK